MIGSLVAGKYELIQAVSDGPIFSSFKGKDKSSGQDVLVRLLNSQLENEGPLKVAVGQVVQRTAVINHSGIEKTIGWFQTQSPAGLVTEWFSGVTLEERLKRLSSFSVPVSIGMALQVCEALSALHSHGVIHGDVCARNILCGQGDAVKLCLAGMFEAYSESEKAGKAAVRSMVSHMAPELNNDSAPNPRTDIYAVGVLLYQLLSGRMPFLGDNTQAIANRHALGQYTGLRQINSSVPQAVDEIVRRCLAKNAFERYPDIDKLIADLHAVEEALRFGKPLVWPNKGPLAAEEPPPVAPNLNVANPGEEASSDPAQPTPKKKVKKKKPENIDGIPSWLSYFLVFMCLVTLIIVSGWAFFAINKRKMVNVPNIVGMTQQKATEELAKVGLKLRVIRSEPNEKTAKDSILATDPPAGKENAYEGSEVLVTISGGSRFVEVPDLRGRTLAEAKTLLESLDLILDENPNRIRSGQFKEGTIVVQVPSNGTRLNRDSRVVVRISAGNRNVSSAASKRYLYRIKFSLPNADAPILVRVELTDDQETRTVLEEERTPGDTIELETEGVGEVATFRVFYDGELKGTRTVKAIDEMATGEPAQPTPDEGEL